MSLTCHVSVLLLLFLHRSPLFHGCLLLFFTSSYVNSCTLSNANCFSSVCTLAMLSISHNHVVLPSLIFKLYLLASLIILLIIFRNSFYVVANIIKSSSKAIQLLVLHYYFLSLYHSSSNDHCAVDIGSPYFRLCSIWNSSHLPHFHIISVFVSLCVILRLLICCS